MLVLGRKSMERILIGNDIVVTVLEIRGNRTRIGIEAPREIHVIRAELQDRTPEPLVGFAPAAAEPIRFRTTMW